MDAHNKTGTVIKNWKFLDAMDNVLGDKPSTKPPILVDTLDLNDEDAENSIQDTIASTAESNGKEDVTDSNSFCDAGSNSTTMRIEIFEHNLRLIAEKCKNCSNKIPPGRKKKRVREDKAVKVMKDVVEQLITAQQESDERFMRLEEKRIKLEEQQIQREECERKEDQEFKLQMMQILMQGVSTHPSQTYSPPSFPLYPPPPMPSSYSETYPEANNFEQQ